MLLKFVPVEVTLIDTMGDDNRVVDAARVSFDKMSENYTQQQNEGLIHYLAKHNHWTPFAHVSATFRVKVTLFVARQLVKHQVGLVWSEVSRRYVDSTPEFWAPSSWRSRAANVKQGSGADLDPFDCVKAIRLLEDNTVGSLSAYKHLLSLGVAPEQARMVLPLNTMTEFIWTGSLAAWARVCKLRLDGHAQLEIQEIAQQISNQLKPEFPVSWPALMENK